MEIQGQIKIRVIRSQQDWDAALAVREEVFIKEQGVPSSIERDDNDDRAIHVIASHEN